MDAVRLALLRLYGPFGVGAGFVSEDASDAFSSAGSCGSCGSPPAFCVGGNGCFFGAEPVPAPLAEELLICRPPRATRIASSGAHGRGPDHRGAGSACRMAVTLGS